MCPLLLTVYDKGDRIRCNTQIKVPVDFWNGTEILKSYPNAPILNAGIAKKVAEINTQIATWEMEETTITEEMVKNLLKPKTVSKANFYDVAGLVLEEMKTLSADATYKRYEVEYRNLKAYKKTLRFADITPNFLDDYYLYLINEGKAHNTTTNAFKFIRRVFNYAKRKGITNQYPFSNWKFPKYVTPAKEYLTLEECEAVMGVLNKEKVDEDYKTVAAFFLLECFSGIRFSDWKNFKVEKIIHDEGLYLRATQKTKQPIYLPLKDSPKLNYIVNYIRSNGLAFNRSLQYANRILKIVAVIADVDKNITTHMGRHTCATLLLQKGISTETVAEVLGVSMKVVNVYAKMTRLKVKAEFEKVGGL